MPEQALAIAMRAHRGQVDLAGEPKIMHAIRVAARFVGEPFLTSIALLHDVVEDSDLTFDDLQDNGADPHQLEVLRLLTRADDEKYFVYIAMIATNLAARRIKVADLEDNTNPIRLHLLHRMGIDTTSLEKRYAKAKAILT